MKLFFKLFGFLFSVGVIAAVAAVIWAGKVYDAPGASSEDRFIIVARGDHLAEIAGRLEEEKLIEHPLVFKIAARLSGAESKLKAGEYLVPARASQRDILALLESGKVYNRAITIPEGLTSYEIVRLINAAEYMEGEITDIPEEGYLLPETYSYARNEPRSAVIARMRAAMEETLNALWESRAENLPFDTKEEALVLASIVEKETGVGEERAKVAGVFVNRLEIGMPLQTDPTVIYAITKGQHENEGKGPLGRRLLRKDLEIDSPYNTYKYPGLPPGPIANPGRAAIEATLNPAEHEYLYFVADGTGGHAFGKTLAEHNKNVREWRKVRREMERKD